MGYFKYTGTFSSFEHEDAWNNVVEQIHSAGVYKVRENILKVQNPLEAKALHLFTFASRFLRAVDLLVANNKGNWHRMFVETSVLLYPIIEMIGSAVKGDGEDKLKLIAGLYWLADPNQLHQLPSQLKEKKERAKDITRIIPMQKYMRDRTIPTVGKMYRLRNYYLHGLGRSSDKNLTKEEYLIDYAISRGMAGAIEDGLYVYWDKLKSDNGKALGWLERLAQADIHPFKISGSNGFEEGLIDPDIVDRILAQRLRDNPQ